VLVVAFSPLITDFLYDWISIMSILHNDSIIVTLDDALKLECPTGFRLAKVIRKDVKTNGVVTKKQTSMGAVIPALDKNAALEFAMTDDVMRDYLFSAIEKAQDATLRIIVEAGTDTTVKHGALDLPSISLWMATTDEGQGRISADAIKQWFTDEIRDGLIVKFANSMGVSDTPTEAETEKLEKIANSFRDSMAQLAGRVKGSIPENVASQLSKAIDIAPDSAWRDRMYIQLRKLTATKEDDITAYAL
jgi:hypothetical protein